MRKSSKYYERESAKMQGRITNVKKSVHFAKMKPFMAKSGKVYFWRHVSFQHLAFAKMLINTSFTRQKAGKNNDFGTFSTNSFPQFQHFRMWKSC